MNKNSTNNTHLKYMHMAIKCADENLKTGNGGPFGAIIVKNGEVIAATPNTVTADNDPTAHAEVNAIRQACKKLHTPDLEGCIMYTSCEPCAMCISAIYWAKIGVVYYGNTKTDADWAGFSDAFLDNELAKPLAERGVSFTRLGASDAMRSFEQWVALSEAQKDEVKNGTL